MLNFDWLNTGIGVGLGGLLGWLISSYYFKRPTRTERISDQIKEGLQKSLFPILYPAFFNPETAQRILPDQASPSDKDIPHVEYALLKQKKAAKDQDVEALIKVADAGFDLDNPRGIAIRDRRQFDLPLVPLGLGYLMTTFRTTPQDALGPCRLTVTLRDDGEHSNAGPNQNVQTLTFNICSGDEHA